MNEQKIEQKNEIYRPHIFSVPGLYGEQRVVYEKVKKTFNFDEEFLNMERVYIPDVILEVIYRRNIRHAELFIMKKFTYLCKLYKLNQFETIGKIVNLGKAVYEELKKENKLVHESQANENLIFNFMELHKILNKEQKKARPQLYNFVIKDDCTVEQCNTYRAILPIENTKMLLQPLPKNMDFSLSIEKVRKYDMVKIFKAFTKEDIINDIMPIRVDYYKIDNLSTCPPIAIGHICRTGCLPRGVLEDYIKKKTNRFTSCVERLFKWLKENSFEDVTVHDFYTYYFDSVHLDGHEYHIEDPENNEKYKKYNDLYRQMYNTDLPTHFTWHNVHVSDLRGKMISRIRKVNIFKSLVEKYGDTPLVRYVYYNVMIPNKNRPKAGYDMTESIIKEMQNRGKTLVFDKY